MHDTLGLVSLIACLLFHEMFSCSYILRLDSQNWLTSGSIASQTLDMLVFFD